MSGVFRHLSPKTATQIQAPLRFCGCFRLRLQPTKTRSEGKPPRPPVTSQQVCEVISQSEYTTVH